jgi:hypothetical protein
VGLAQVAHDVGIRTGRKVNQLTNTSGHWGRGGLIDYRTPPYEGEVE